MTPYKLNYPALARVLQNGGAPAVNAAERAINDAILIERERCARIAHDRGLKSHKDFRWLAEEIEMEIRNR